MEALSPAALVQDQGIADQFNEGGECQNVLEAAAAMLPEDLVEDGGFQEIRPERQSGIGQGGALDDKRGEKLQRQVGLRGKSLQKGKKCGGRIETGNTVVPLGSGGTGTRGRRRGWDPSGALGVVRGEAGAVGGMTMM